MRKMMLKAFLVFAVSAGWFAVMIPWHGFNDPDAFYHATASRLLWEHGPIRSFPQLDLTLLGSSYADLHFGFHLFVAPFTAAFGDLQGLRIASVILCGLCLAAFYLSLRWLKVRIPLVWTALLLTATSFAMRASLGKATPFALTLFIFGLVAAWKRKPWLVAFLTFVFALSHGGWLFLAGSIVLLAFGDALYNHMVQDMPWRATLIRSRWREIFAGFLGGVAGLLLHPNFPNVIRFSFAQVVTIGLGTPYQHVLMGTEWLPPDLSGMFASYAVWVIAALLGLSGLLLARREPFDEDRARLLVSMGWIMAALTALTLKSRRNAEYLTPVVALWCGVLWSLVDAKRLWAVFMGPFVRMRPWVRTAAVSFVLGICLVAFGKQLIELYASINPAGYADDVYAVSMKAISDRAQPGDRVFHSSWDEFPMLYHADQRLRYVSGLDPTFLYIASSTLSDEVKEVTWDISTSTKEVTWSLIHDQLHSRFVFVSRKNHQTFLTRIQGDERYVQIASSTDSAAFVISSEMK